MSEQAASEGDGTEQPEVVSWEKYEALRERYDAAAAELAELRPLRSDLIAIHGIVTREPLGRV